MILLYSSRFRNTMYEQVLNRYKWILYGGMTKSVTIARHMGQQTHKSGQLIQIT